MTGIRKFLNPKVRAYIYALSGIFHTFALVYFGVTDETWTLWTTAALGLFDASLALLNTPGVTSNVVEAGQHAAVEE